MLSCRGRVRGAEEAEDKHACSLRPSGPAPRVPDTLLGACDDQPGLVVYLRRAAFDGRDVGRIEGIHHRRGGTHVSVDAVQAAMRSLTDQVNAAMRPCVLALVVGVLLGGGRASAQCLDWSTHF